MWSISKRWHCRRPIQHHLSGVRHDDFWLGDDSRQLMDSRSGGRIQGGSGCHSHRRQHSRAYKQPYKVIKYTDLLFKFTQNNNFYAKYKGGFFYILFIFTKSNYSNAEYKVHKATFHINSRNQSKSQDKWFQFCFDVPVPQSKQTYTYLLVNLERTDWFYTSLRPAVLLKSGDGSLLQADCEYHLQSLQGLDCFLLINCLEWRFQLCDLGKQALTFNASKW